MGRARRPQPARIAEKVIDIRRKLDLSQNEMISRMGLSDVLTQAEVSAFERGIRVPPLTVLLEYSRAANIYLEALVDDSLDLPGELPSAVKHEGIKRRLNSTKKR